MADYKSGNSYCFCNFDSLRFSFWFRNIDIHSLHYLVNMCRRNFTVRCSLDGLLPDYELHFRIFDFGEGADLPFVCGLLCQSERFDVFNLAADSISIRA